jgi:hypothetical protein
VTTKDETDLLQLKARFTSGDDRSQSLANEIEGIVLECFRDQPWFEDTSTMLAQYSPVADEHYVTGDDLSAQLKIVANALDPGSK